MDKQIIISKPVFIYGLYDPRQDGVIRYIGKANNLKKRLSSHLRDAKRRKTPVYDWINSLTRVGVIPKMILIKESTELHWVNDEISIIAEYKSKDCRLLNVALGGDQPACPREVRADNGRKNAKAIHSDPKRKRLWYLKKELGAYFKKTGDTPKVLELKKKLASAGVYL